MKTLKIALLIILTLSSVLLKAQEHNISFLKEIGAGPFLILSRPAYVSEYKSIDIPNTLKLKEIMYYDFDLYPEGELYRDMKSGKISAQKFRESLQYLTSKPIDTVLLNEFIKHRQSRVHFFSAIGLHNQHYIGFDGNYNGRIDSGELLIFSHNLVKSVKKSIEKHKNQLINIKLNEKGGIIGLNVRIIPLPYFDTYNDQKEKRTAFYLHLNEFWRPLQKDRQFYAQRKKFSTFDNEPVVKDSMHLNKTAAVLTKGASYYYKDYKLTFVAYKLRNEILTAKLDYQKEQSNETTVHFDNNLINIKDRKRKNIQEYLNKGEYILLDFWGSWCNPCIANFPELKKIQRKYKNKLTVVGLAYDKNIEIVEKTLKEHNVIWDNYLIDMKSGQDLLKRIEVSHFPTYKLFNKDGKLLKIWTGKINKNELKKMMN